jgi:predicted permease
MKEDNETWQRTWRGAVAGTVRRTWDRIAGFRSSCRQAARPADGFENRVQVLNEENVRRVVSESAPRSALKTFAGVEAGKGDYHDRRGLSWFENLQRDICFAFRAMRRSLGFTAVTVASLALGIGANAAIFIVANAVIIRSLPVRDPGQLVLLRYELNGDISPVRRTQAGDGENTFPYHVYEAVSQRAQTLEVIAFVPLGMNQQSLTIQAGGQTTVAGGEMVSGNYFQVLGVSPVLGRVIMQDDVEPAAPNVAVISHDFWRRELGGDRSVIGRSITLNGLPFTVVGVMPPEFFGINPAAPPDLWISLRDLRGLKPWGRLRSGPGGLSPFADKGYWWCLIVGRVKPGASKQRALAEADVIFRESITAGVGETLPTDRVPHLALSSARRGLETLRRNLSEPIWILMVAVSMVLLVACANVTTLLLARGKAREREMLVRLELGAPRSRLVHQLLVESIVLSLLGGAVGLLLAGWSSEGILRMFAAGQPIPLDVHPDATALAFVAAVSLATGTLLGLVPALRATRASRAPQLFAAAGRCSPRATLSRLLVVAQAALAVFLLFGAGLFVRTLQNLDGQDLGFNRNNLLLFEIDPRRRGASPDRTLDIYNSALETIQALPGVRSASVSVTALLSGNTDCGPVATDGPWSQQPIDVYFNIVGPDFVKTLGIQLLSGRDVTWRDIRERHRIAVVNEVMAHRLFPNQEPIGRSFSFEVPFDARNSYEIVGVSKNAKYDGLRADPPPTAYLPYSPLSERIARMCFAVRTAGDPLSLVGGIRETIRRIDPALPVIDIRTQKEQIVRILEHERMFAGLSSLFGLLALLLVGVGLYGTLGYAVVQRTSEIGIRAALGATRQGILWMVLRESLLLAGCGLIVGLPAALLLARLLASRFFRVEAHDFVTILVTVTVLLVTAAIAGFAPANRASRIDPLLAMRHD